METGTNQLWEVVFMYFAFCFLPPVGFYLIVTGRLAEWAGGLGRDPGPTFSYPPQNQDLQPGVQLIGGQYYRNGQLLAHKDDAFTIDEILDGSDLNADGVMD